MVSTLSLAFLSRRAGKQRGTSSLELGIVMLLLTSLTIGVVDFALGVRSYFSLASAAREAARYAAVRSVESRDPATVDKIAQRVRSQLVLVNEDKVQVSAQWDPGNYRGSSVRVSVTYPYEPITNLLPVKTITITTSSQSVITE